MHTSNVLLLTANLVKQRREGPAKCCDGRIRTRDLQINKRQSLRSQVLDPILHGEKRKLTSGRSLTSIRSRGKTMLTMLTRLLP